MREIGTVASTVLEAIYLLIRVLWESPSSVIGLVSSRPVLLCDSPDDWTATGIKGDTLITRGERQTQGLVNARTPLPVVIGEYGTAFVP